MHVRVHVGRCKGCARVHLHGVCRGICLCVRDGMPIFLCGSLWPQPNSTTLKQRHGQNSDSVTMCFGQLLLADVQLVVNSLNTQHNESC
jgi:hypothetical protein